MNKDMTVCFADSRAREYEKAANGRKGSSMFHTKYGLVYEDKAEVKLGKNNVQLKLEIREGSFGGHNWVRNTNEDDRVNACRQVCFGNIRYLATFLSCNPKLIEVEWDCEDGNVRGTVTGDEALAAWNAEQEAESNPRE